jgi:hypothetical protein
MSKHFNDGALLQELEEEVDRLEAKKTVITGKMYRNLKRENGRLKKENDELKKYAETFVPNSTNMAEIELEEIYEALVGDNGMERFTHAEIIDWAHQLVDKEEEI